MINAISAGTLLKIKSGNALTTRNLLREPHLRLPNGAALTRWTLPPARPAEKRQRRKAYTAKAASVLRVRPETETGLEKLMLLLLVVAAVVGIAYGFSCMVDLVQNWAIFERGTANLI
jgi:hypothetical protein